MGKSMLPVTVVTPSYNQADYLEQTIRSVLGQNYPDLEYIIVDGGSNDGSVDIIRDYEQDLAWWVSEPDSGQAEAINKGLKCANGEIVAWLNSDDLYAPGAIAQAVAAMEQNPDLGMVYGDALSFDQGGHPLNELSFGDWDLKEFVTFHIICQPAVFMRRSVVEQAGFLNPDYHFLLDHHLWLRIARIAGVQHVPQIWAFARHHRQAKNVAQAAEFGREAYRLLAWMQTQPDLAVLLERNHRSVWAAAHRFNARYLLDGGQAWPALKSYLRSLSLHPSTALQEGHRILFAALSLLGAGWLGDLYYRRKRSNIPDAVQDFCVENIDNLYG
jgi:glycosyltransferase involved in cell wall biosynthesis